MTAMLATWFSQPAHEMEMRAFATRDEAEYAAWVWMVGRGLIPPDLPIDDMLSWWFDPSENGGCNEDYTIGCVIREVQL